MWDEPLAPCSGRPQQAPAPLSHSWVHHRHRVHASRPDAQRAAALPRTKKQEIEGDEYNENSCQLPAAAKTAAS